MATFVLTDSGIFVHEHEITDAAGALSVETSVDTPDATTFGSGGWREFLPALKTTAFGVDGYADFGTDLSDEALFGKLGLADRVISVVPEGPTEGNIAFSATCVAGSYSGIGGAIGDIAGFQLGAQASSYTTRGTLMHYGEETNAHDGTGFQLGAASSAIYGALHVFSGTGSITVEIESDDNSGFTTPTTRLTFTAVAGTSSAEWATATGAISDTWWRMTATFTGTRKWAVVLGVD